MARRRRLEDEGEEEEGSIGEELDDSLSEGSVLTIAEDDPDAEGSDISEDEATTASTKAEKAGGQVNGDDKHRSKTEPPRESGFNKMTDTELMMNGMKISESADAAEELHFDEMGSEHGTSKEQNAASKVEQPPRRETFAEKKRREHEEYIKERNENPAFVPTRGGFFLHDKRSESGSNGYRPSNNKKSRPHGLIVDSNIKRYVDQKKLPNG